MKENFAEQNIWGFSINPYQQTGSIVALEEIAAAARVEFYPGSGYVGENWFIVAPDTVDDCTALEQLLEEFGYHAFKVEKFRYK